MDIGTTSNNSTLQYTFVDRS